jgi:hypothetical protein
LFWGARGQLVIKNLYTKRSLQVEMCFHPGGASFKVKSLIAVDFNTCRIDFDSSIACKRIFQRVKSLDSLPSKRGKYSFSSLVNAMKVFFKQCNYQFRISLTSKKIDGPIVVLSADVALQITVAFDTGCSAEVLRYDD